MNADTMQMDERPLIFFFPTRFHIFDQLETEAFENVDFQIYSIYPPRYFRSGRFAMLKQHNRTLWLGLILRGLMRTAGKLGVNARIARRLRSLYIAGCALEFRIRTRRYKPSLIVASAGYLGRLVNVLRLEGHKIVVNHGSLYEPYERKQMQNQFGLRATDDTANWAHLGLIARMELEFATANAIILCSPTALATFPKIIQPRIHVVPLGSPDILEKRRPIGLRHRSKGVTFLHISNLSLRKNVSNVLDAFAQVRNGADRLVIGGPTPHDPNLRRRIASPEPGVTWLGRLHREDVLNSMYGADIFVHPSFADGWGMVITEALAAGLPVISSPLTGAASYYAGQSPEGAEPVVLVDPTSSSDIARGMSEMRTTLLTCLAFTPIVPKSWNDSAMALQSALAILRDDTSAVE